MNDRITRFVHSIQQSNLSGFALNPGPTLTYLTGLQFHLMERPTVAIFTARGDIALVLPLLEQQKLAGLPFKAQPFFFGDDPSTWWDAFRQAFKGLGLTKGEVALEPTRMRVLELRFMESATREVKFVDGSELLADLRMRKDADEVAKMRAAAVIAQNALLETLALIHPGMSEREIASELVIQLYRAGSDVELPFQPIVSSGPNSANPHASPSDRILQEGDLLLFDWGASKDGYFSDITRTFTVGSVDPELLRIGEYVLGANTAARAAARPGIPVGLVDSAARGVIEAAGYADYFTHRTGHGLGMEAHEAPYVFGENDLSLQPGMTFTIEPGIYLPDRAGVRIEDDVVVTEDGVLSLTDLPRQLLPLESFKA